MGEYIALRFSIFDETCEKRVAHSSSGVWDRGQEGSVHIYRENKPTYFRNARNKPNLLKVWEKLFSIYKFEI